MTRGEGSWARLSVATVAALGLAAPAPARAEGRACSRLPVREAIECVAAGPPEVAAIDRLLAFAPMSPELAPLRAAGVALRLGPDRLILLAREGDGDRAGPALAALRLVLDLSTLPGSPPLAAGDRARIVAACAGALDAAAEKARRGAVACLRGLGDEVAPAALVRALAKPRDPGMRLEVLGALLALEAPPREALATVRAILATPLDEKWLDQDLSLRHLACAFQVALPAALGAEDRAAAAEAAVALADKSSDARDVCRLAAHQPPLSPAAPRRPHAHVIEDGETLESIAFAEGTKAMRIYLDPANADFRARDPDPGKVTPGDVLMIPEIAQSLNLDLDGVGDVPVRLLLEGIEMDAVVRTGASQSFSVALPPGIVDVQLAIDSLKLWKPLTFGGLAAVGTLLGLQQRLQNLGYDSPESGERDAATRAAVRRFQEDHHLRPTGKLDAATRKAIHDAHGA